MDKYFENVKKILEEAERILKEEGEKIKNYN